MSTNNRMLNMIDSFERKRNSDEVVGLENTDLFRYFKSGGDRYQLVKRVNGLLGKELRLVVKELREKLLKNRFLYGFTHSESYALLNVDFAKRFGFALTENRRNKNEQLAYVLRKGHPCVSEGKLLSFLNDNRERFEQAVRDAAVIALACDAASHRDRYKTDRIDRIISETSDHGSGDMTVDKEAVELLMERLRDPQNPVSDDDDNLVILIESSQLVPVSFGIVGNSWVRINSHKTGYYGNHVNPRFRFHYACIKFDLSGADPWSPDGDSYEITHDKYIDELSIVESGYPEDYQVLQDINKDGRLNAFGRIFVSEDVGEATGRPTTGVDDSASFEEVV